MPLLLSLSVAHILTRYDTLKVHFLCAIGQQGTKPQRSVVRRSKIVVRMTKVVVCRNEVTSTRSA